MHIIYMYKSAKSNKSAVDELMTEASWLPRVFYPHLAFCKKHPFSDFLVCTGIRCFSTSHFPASQEITPHFPVGSGPDNDGKLMAPLYLIFLELTFISR